MDCIKPTFVGTIVSVEESSAVGEVYLDIKMSSDVGKIERIRQLAFLQVLTNTLRLHTKQVSLWSVL